MRGSKYQVLVHRLPFASSCGSLPDSFLCIHFAHAGCRTSRKCQRMCALPNSPQPMTVKSWINTLVPLPSRGFIVFMSILSPRTPEQAVVAHGGNLCDNTVFTASFRLCIFSPPLPSFPWINSQISHLYSNPFRTAS